MRILPVPGWDRFPGLVAGFCGRTGGVSRGPFAALNLSTRVSDDAVAVHDNWQRVAATVGGALRFVTMRQVHGAEIANADGAEITRINDTAGEVGSADALAGRAPAVALCVLTADCVPLLLVAPRHHVVAAVHAGWRGTLAGIAGRTLQHLQQVFGVEPDAVHATLGPAIGACCYEVDATVADALEGRWGTMPQAIRRVSGAGVLVAKATVDLRGVNRAQLLAAGMLSEAIAEVGPCTRCAMAEYFSYRGAATLGATTTGRQVSFVGWR